MKKIKQLTMLFIICVITFSNFNVKIYANIDELEINSETAILMDMNSGSVLYDKNIHKKMYPASMTKILTAIVMLDYIGVDELITVGYEINEISLDSSRAGHEVGEIITGENLLRGLIIPSGNETANIVALNVALRHSGKSYLEYSQAEKIFMELMNEKAKELGAVNSNFVTPHGYHHDDHYSTAYDMALITRAAMEYEVIRNIAMEVEYRGLSAGENYDGDGKNIEHYWYTHNNLINSSPYYYPYATGLKTGYTSKAGNTLTATATKDDISLIAVLFNGEKDINRWLDSKNLFEYGFNNYSYYNILEKEVPIFDTEVIDNRLGVEPTVSVAPNENFRALLLEEELDDLIYKINYLPEFLATGKNETNEKGEPILKAPISKGEIIGTITYTFNGEEIYTGEVISMTEVLERTFKSDMSYYFEKTKDYVFSWNFIPVLISIVAIVSFITDKIKKYKKNNIKKYKTRKQRKRRRYRSKY